MTPAERAAWHDASPWAARSALDTKLETLLKALFASWQPLAQAHPWPAGTDLQAGKLSRGQAYTPNRWLPQPGGAWHRQPLPYTLPYWVLDYPRWRDADGYGLFRAVVVWGYRPSLHLILGGGWAQAWRPGLASQLGQGHWSGWTHAQTDSPWYWEPYGPNAAPLSAQSLEQEAEEAGRDFLKISRYR